MPESVTHVPGLNCYLCTWTIPEEQPNNPFQRRPRSKSLIVSRLQFAAPLNVSVRPVFYVSSLKILDESEVGA